MVMHCIRAQVAQLAIMVQELQAPYVLGGPRMHGNLPAALHP